jgi:phosphoenolpyruvate-protein kinase (PTS system EI component)
MGQASCRILDRLDQALQNAADKVGLFRSEVIRRALIYYI